MAVKRYQARIRLGSSGSAVVVYDAEESSDAAAVLKRRYNLADDDVIRLDEIGDAFDYNDDQGPLLTRTEIAAIVVVVLGWMVLLIWYFARVVVQL